MAKIILHIREAFIDEHFSRYHLELYQRIEAMAVPLGIPVERVPRGDEYEVDQAFEDDGRFDDGHLHIFDHSAVQAKGVLNAAVSYFWGYWQLDPQGVHGRSQIAQARFDPEMVDFKIAQPYFQKLRRQYVNHRHSRYDQPHSWQDFPDGAVSIFFQGRDPILQKTCDFSDLEIVNIVREYAGDRPIIVKPHPLLADVFVVKDVLEIAESDPRIIVTDANVHDILRASDVTVSMHSTVALEGYLHRKPTILFGRSDFHHIAEVVQKREEFPGALACALEGKRLFQKYLYWFLEEQSINLNADDAEDRIWQRFAQAGFPKEMLIG